MKRWFQKKDKKSRGSTPVMTQADPSAFVDGLVYGQLILHDQYHARDYESQHDSSSRHDSDSGGSSYDSGSSDSGSSDCGGCGGD